MITRRNLCSIALAGLFPLAVSAADKKPRIAVVYVSRTGHTRSVAEAVRSMTGADLFHIETVEPYPDEYRATTEVVKEEIEKNVKRPIKPLGINLDQYDVVILGTPTWWHRPAQPLKTWMETV
ncbi:MAG: flavodoxin, partial [Sutterella wadsworthensis]|nr:flavodoxin [Sutterella wadsworthensis]